MERRTIQVLVDDSPERLLGSKKKYVKVGYYGFPYYLKFLSVLA